MADIIIWETGICKFRAFFAYKKRLNYYSIIKIVSLALIQFLYTMFVSSWWSFYMYIKDKMLLRPFNIK